MEIIALNVKNAQKTDVPFTPAIITIYVCYRVLRVS